MVPIFHPSWYPSQWVFDDFGEEVVESDAQARRIWWIDDYVSDLNSYTLPGTSQP